MVFVDRGAPACFLVCSEPHTFILVPRLEWDESLLYGFRRKLDISGCEAYVPFATRCIEPDMGIDVVSVVLVAR